MAATDARPIAIKNTAYRLPLAFFKLDNTLITGWTGADTELSLDGAAYADATAEATEIGATGTGYVDLSAAEMNADMVWVKITLTNSGAQPFLAPLNPQESGDVRVEIQSAQANTLNASALATDAVTEIVNATWANATRSLTDKAGFSLTQVFPANFSSFAITAGGAITVGTNGDKIGYTLTAPERTAVANEVEAQIIDETDSEKVLTAITDKIASVNPSLGGLTVAAIASASATSVWGAAGRTLTSGANIVLAKGVGVTGFNDIAAGAAMTLTVGERTAVANANWNTSSGIYRSISAGGIMTQDMYAIAEQVWAYSMIDLVTQPNGYGGFATIGYYLTSGTTYPYSTFVQEAGPILAGYVWSDDLNTYVGGSPTSFANTFRGLPTAAKNASAVWDERVATHAIDAKAKALYDRLMVIYDVGKTFGPPFGVPPTPPSATTEGYAALAAYGRIYLDAIGPIKSQFIDAGFAADFDELLVSDYIVPLENRVASPSDPANEWTFGQLARSIPALVSNGASPDFVTISGAGDINLNGFYSKRGVLNGKPYYNPTDFSTSQVSFVAKWTGTAWMIAENANTFYTSASNVDYPWLATNWVSGGTAAPALPVLVSPGLNTYLMSSTGGTGGAGGGGLTEQQDDKLQSIFAQTANIVAGRVKVLPPTSNVGGEINVKRGDTWNIPLSGLGDLSGNPEIWLIVKDNPRQADADSIMQLNTMTGLVVVSGMPYATPANGTISVIDSAAGNIVATVVPATTDSMAPRKRAFWTIKVVRSSIDVRTIAEGVFNINEGSLIG